MEEGEYQRMFALEDRYWWFVAKHGYITALLGQPDRKKSTRVVDVGAGTGGTTVFLGRYGDVVAVEPPGTALAFLRQRKLKIVAGRAEAIPITAAAIDLVCILDVLYHRNVRDDVTSLREAYRILKPGGTLLVTDCAFDFLRSSHDEAVHARQRYTKAELAAKVTQSGFHIQRATYTFMLTFPALILKRAIGKLQSSRTSDVSQMPTWLNTLLVLLCRIEVNLLKITSLPLGSSIAIKAQK